MALARLFVDRTRGQARRWCSTAVCGNRAKQAAHRNRLKASARRAVAADACRYQCRCVEAAQAPRLRPWQALPIVEQSPRKEFLQMLE